MRLGKVIYVIYLLTRLVEVSLTVNLANSEFARATVTYLGKLTVQGYMRPFCANVEAIDNFPHPTKLSTDNHVIIQLNSVQVLFSSSDCWPNPEVMSVTTVNLTM